MEPLSEDALSSNAERKQAVRAAFLHAWRGYFDLAMGHDEVSPVSNGTNDSWGRFGVTLIDALDTFHLILMRDGAADERMPHPETVAAYFEAAVEHVRTIDWTVRDYDASFFEMTIRYLGGLLSIYEMSQNDVFLVKATELADRLVYAFETPTGIPYSIVNLRSGKGRNPSWNTGSSILSELGSVQLEFKQLSKLTGEPHYDQLASAVISRLHKMDNLPIPGLYPVFIHPQTGLGTTDLVSFGGLGDSFYEYLLKQYAMSQGADLRAKEMYLSAVEALRANLIAVSKDGRKYLSEMKSGALTGGFDHLVCYVPGMLALGTQFIPGREADLALAADLLDTCISLYLDQPTELGPERVEWLPHTAETPYRIASPRYLLRPETVESIFIFYRITKEQKYRDAGWLIFEALEKYCKTPAAYSGLRDVTNIHSSQDNSMQSFFMAETLKYLFLLFSDDDVLPLDQYVFNTEAHPFKIRN